METTNEIKWNLEVVLCISETKKFDIEHWKKTNLSGNDMVSFNLFIQDENKPIKYRECEDDIEYSHRSTKFTQHLLAQVICNKNIEFLNRLNQHQTEEEKKTKFYSLLSWIQLISGSYALTNLATNSDFWNIIEQGNIRSIDFSSFHFFSYLYHKGKNNRLDTMFNFYKNEDLGTEGKINETRNYMSMVVNRTIELLKTNHYDELFKECFERRCAGFNSKEELKDFINQSTTTGFFETSIIVSKLESLGF
jgi:hypothetical protein